MALRSLRLRNQSIWLGPIMHFCLTTLAGVVVPFAVLGSSYPTGWQDYVLQTTLLACLAGNVFGFWLYRSFSELPGTYESFGILPSYLTAFGIVLVAIVIYRIEYSRALLITSFIGCIAMLFAIYLTVQRQRVLRLGIIEGGRTGELGNLAGIQAKSLTLEDWPRDIDAVTADFRFAHSAQWEARIADFTLAGVPVYHSKDLIESLTGRAELETLSENTFGALGPIQSWLAIKWIIDWVLALILLPLFAPIMIITAIAIRLDSPGPILFRQSRAGFRGRDFTVFKFRTMTDKPVTDAEEGLDDLITARDDARITRLGRFLRFTRIDELPQLFNVLRGEMSLIGPRPEAAKLSSWYQAEVPFYRYRHIVRPGITGWAQVNQGHVASLADIKKKLEYDFYYIRNFSIWLDVLIVMKTIKTVFTGFGHK